MLLAKCSHIDNFDLFQIKLATVIAATHCLPPSCLKISGLLSEVRFGEVIVSQIPSKWRLLGISLHISTEKLDGFAKKHCANLNQCFYEVFRSWKVANSPSAPFTSSNLMQALQRNFVGEDALAAQQIRTFSIPEGKQLHLLFLFTFSIRNPVAK